MAIIVNNSFGQEAPKMKRLVIAAICAGLILGLCEARYVANLNLAGNENSLYCLAFSRIGATLLESRLDAWATIKKKNSTQEMKERLMDIGRALEIPIDPQTISTSSTGDITVVRTSVTKNNGRYYLTAQASKGYTLLLVSVIFAAGKDATNNIIECQKRIKKILPAQTASQYTGVLAGEVASSKREPLINRMFEVFEAQMIEVYKTSNAVSATGYTPFISSHLGYGKKQYNLQAAVHYNPTENKTYIYLGTPLLLGEY